MDMSRPCYYANIAVPFLIGEICKSFGCSKDELQISIFGGADSVRKEDVFKIGARNIKAVKSAINSLKLTCGISEVGGTNSRTIELDSETGRIKVVRQPLVL